MDDELYTASSDAHGHRHAHRSHCCSDRLRSYRRPRYTATNVRVYVGRTTRWRGPAVSHASRRLAARPTTANDDYDEAASTCSARSLARSVASSRQQTALSLSLSSKKRRYDAAATAGRAQRLAGPQGGGRPGGPRRRRPGPARHVPCSAGQPRRRPALLPLSSLAARRSASLVCFFSTVASPPRRRRRRPALLAR